MAFDQWPAGPGYDRGVWGTRVRIGGSVGTRAGRRPLGTRLPSAFDLLLDVLPIELPRAREMARSGRDACAESALDTEYSPEKA